MFILSLSKDLRRGETHQLFATSNTVTNCDRLKVRSELGGHVKMEKRQRQSKRERND